MHELQLPYDRQTLCKLLARRRDSAFSYAILREYLRHNLPRVHAFLRKIIRVWIITPK